MNRSKLRTLLRGTGCAQESGEFVFLCDPRWSETEQAEVRALQRASVVDRPLTAGGLLGWLCIPTGGTGGAIRFAGHDEATLMAAVAGFTAHFGLPRVNAVDVLPPFHVSGLMARVRCAATGGTHLAWDWKRLEAGQPPLLPAGARDWVISLVPTQLQRLLRSPAATAWLQQFTIVFLGGGPPWPALTEDAATKRIRVSLSYGMTETAAMIAAQTPEQFITGDRSCGFALPHARVALAPDSTIQVGGESVFRGYFPGQREERTFGTADLGEIDADGRLTVHGRRDAVIISGGEKVNPVEVEAVLRGTNVFEDVAVIGIPDTRWGECVVACYPAAGTPDLSLVRQRVAEELPGYKRPKRYIALDGWPRNALGKVSREVLRARLAAPGIADAGP